MGAEYQANLQVTQFHVLPDALATYQRKASLPEHIPDIKPMFFSILKSKKLVAKAINYPICEYFPSHG